MLRFQPPYWLVATLFAAGHTDAMAAYALHDDAKEVRRFATQALVLLQLVWFFFSLFQAAPSVPFWHHAVKVMSILLGFFVFSIDREIKSRRIPPSDLSAIVASATNSSIRVQRRRRKNTNKSFIGQDSLVVAVGCLGSDESALSGCTTLQEIEAHHRNYPPHLRFPLWMKDIVLSAGLFLRLLQRYDRPDCSFQNPVLEYRFRLAYFSGRSLRASRLLDTKYQETAMDAFKLVDVQLSFMFDYFFSAHSSPSLTHPSIYLAYYLSKIALLLSIYLVFFIDTVSDTPHHVTITTASSLAVLILLELLQFHRFFMASKWSLVAYMSNRVKGQPCSLFEPKQLPQLPSRPLKLGQYSLVEDFDCNSMGQRLLGLLGLSQKGTRATYVDLPENLINATLCSLENLIHRDTSPRSSNSAVTSLWRSSLLDEALAWTSMQDTHIHTILIWHIATSYGEAQSSAYPMAGHTLYYFGIATKLSRYCAYLVAFLSELLPGDSLTTHMVLKELLQEAKMLFGHTARTPDSINEKRKKLLKLALPEESSQTTLQKGVRLGRQLHGSHHNQEEHWRMVASSWIRIYLHVAPSDNVAGHIEQLAKGGEFLTHLWACLSNLGILKWEMKDANLKCSTISAARK
ncbi:uncharacterized protein LOC119279039 [Triticum dicoccoides]|uniref:uncharacterized protein LOC119279039 n=1 Tax=Triticum dicoccoides TaxID=85692 RepID=UPI000E789F38|nr:uncharacterized protein LOC119279039 [Triticum dicoccoides]